MIKAILFDFDGVLTIDKTGSETITNDLSRACGIPLETVKACYYPYNRRLLFGETTHRQIWPDFCRDLGQDIDFDILLDSFRRTRLDGQMIGLVQKLKQSYLIGMVTDNKGDRIDAVVEAQGLQPYFDAVAVSAHLHSGKDQSAIFDYVLDTLHVSACECIFIDNTEKNLLVPRRMGMHTLWFQDDPRDFGQFAEELDKLIETCSQEPD